MFQAVDLGSNFYYSYSYDMSHSLQYNLRNKSIFQLNFTIYVSFQELCKNQFSWAIIILVKVVRVVTKAKLRMVLCI
jgi:SacI homology domain